MMRAAKEGPISFGYGSGCPGFTVKLSLSVPTRFTHLPFINLSGQMVVTSGSGNEFQPDTGSAAIPRQSSGLCCGLPDPRILRRPFENMFGHAFRNVGCMN